MDWTRRGAGAKTMDLVSGYQEFVKSVVDATGWPDTILHIHAGLGIFLCAHLLFRRSRSLMFPLFVTLLMELGNETLDWLYYGSPRWSDTLPDILHTMFWPVMLTFVLRAAAPFRVERRRMARS